VCRTDRKVACVIVRRRHVHLRALLTVRLTSHVARLTLSISDLSLGIIRCRLKFSGRGDVGEGDNIETAHAWGERGRDIGM